MTTCQLSVSDHTTSAPVGLSGFPSPPEGLPSSHTTRDSIKDPVSQSFRRFIGLRCVSCNICITCGLLESFSVKKQCVKNFRLHVKKWWWLSPPLLKVVVTVTSTTFKSGGDMSPPSHTKLRLCGSITCRSSAERSRDRPGTSASRTQHRERYSDAKPWRHL